MTLFYHFCYNYFRLMKRFFPLLLIFVFLVFFPLYKTRAEEDCNLLCLETKIKDLERSLELSKAATAPLEGQLAKFNTDLKSIQNQIAFLEGGIIEKEAELKTLQGEIGKSEKELSRQEDILSHRIRLLYKRSFLDNPLVVFFAQKEALALSRELAYRHAVSQKDKSLIISSVMTLSDFEDKKKQAQDLKTQLENETGRLSKAKEETAKQAEFLKTEIAKAQDFQSTLGTQIATLTARQQDILNAKTGLFSTSVGDVPLADDPASRPDYNPGFSPAFAAFSFGAPHFKGMSQYGAFGRAKNGQNADAILHAYYGGGIEIKKDYSTDINISVQGHGSFNIEEYVKRIYEVPNSWGDDGGYEALKAQAVAARSYALAYTNNGSGSICDSESCQVFQDNPKGGNWERAVNDTRGWVLVTGGQPFSAWYAAVSGGYQESYSSQGYSTPGFWDTKCGSKDCWTAEAYEKLAGAPWFYKAWYKTRSGASCGRSHPWLTSDEFADIVNAAIVYQNGGDMSGVFPLDVQSCFGGGDTPWSKDRLKQEADKNGGSVSSVSSVSVQYSTGGITAKVIIDGREFDGQKFMKAFNLRAPGAINLKSGLYNLEKK